MQTTLGTGKYTIRDDPRVHAIKGQVDHDDESEYLKLSAWLRRYNEKSLPKSSVKPEPSRSLTASGQVRKLSIKPAQTKPTSLLPSQNKKSSPLSIEIRRPFISAVKKASSITSPSKGKATLRPHASQTNPLKGTIVPIMRAQKSLVTHPSILPAPRIATVGLEEEALNTQLFDTHGSRRRPFLSSYPGTAHGSVHNQD
jgi:hypothetical protein